MLIAESFRGAQQGPDHINSQNNLKYKGFYRGAELKWKKDSIRGGRKKYKCISS